MVDKYKEAKNTSGTSYNREITREKNKEGSKVQANIGTINLIISTKKLS